MQRQKHVFPLTKQQQDIFKQKMLNWVQQFSIFSFLDSNNYASPHGRYKFLLAAGAVKTFNEASGGLQELAAFHKMENDWLFGHINYDYKNALLSRLSSRHQVKVGFPEIHFFVPEVVLYIEAGSDELIIASAGHLPADIFKEIENAGITEAQPLPALSFISPVSKETYLTTIQKLRQHIADGDCYEINFCTEGYCENAVIDPLSVFNKLNALSPAPFAAFYRLHERYMMCASPERYLQKNGGTIIAQPIKGTARRGQTAEDDDNLKKALRNSIKEQAENVMITDLMRNDLARCCEVGSVQVEELFGIYTFPQVHQMISTISGTLKQGYTFADALQYSFPMGSMTGAPKVKVMELIEQYEMSRRELFSGTLGYITPEGNFDFNVVIRSLFYNLASLYLSYQAGGAITFDSNAEQEWNEMQLKTWALQRIFNS